MFVIPWTQVASAQPCSGDKFAGENDTGVDQTAEYEIAAAHKACQRSKQGGESVYREHPYGGSARKVEVSSTECMKRGKYHF